MPESGWGCGWLGYVDLCPLAELPGQGLSGGVLLLPSGHRSACTAARLLPGRGLSSKSPWLTELVSMETPIPHHLQKTLC